MTGKVVRACAFLLVIVIAGGCSPAKRAMEEGSATLIIRAVQGPISPVERQGVINTAALSGAHIRVASDLNSSSAYSTEQTTNADGIAVFHVEPGTYTVQPLPFPSSLPRPGAPVTVTAPDHDTVRAQVEYDTGIR